MKPALYMRTTQSFSRRTNSQRGVKKPKTSKNARKANLSHRNISDIGSGGAEESIKNTE